MSEPSAVQQLDEETAYEAMRVFIEAYWERGGRSSDDLAVLLGSFEIDPALRCDWSDAIKRVLASAS